MCRENHFGVEHNSQNRHISRVVNDVTGERYYWTVYLGKLLVRAQSDKLRLVCVDFEPV